MASDFNWKKVNGANYYRFILYQIKKGRDFVIADMERDDTEYKITDLRKLDTGSFYWTLQALERDSAKDIIRKSSILKSDFRITLGSPMKKADVTSIKIENL